MGYNTDMQAAQAWSASDTRTRRNTDLRVSCICPRVADSPCEGFLPPACPPAPAPSALISRPCALPPKHVRILSDGGLPGTVPKVTV